MYCFTQKMTKLTGMVWLQSIAGSPITGNDQNFQQTGKSIPKDGINRDM